MQFETTSATELSAATIEAVKDTTTAVPATTTTTAAAEPDECTYEVDCVALNGGANLICEAGTCVPDNSQSNPFTHDGVCTTPGETCSDSGFCHVASEAPDSWQMLGV
ncbi:hypothetical protein FGADI_2446 [Fusarium gaditjirri]|uniref:Uncharacterized protein n=1 Tax=Fusarium gaditjirri TaxID=282569 RepID=A0A8H4X1X6_9HYPO|nr:hypothetical protein FGADI_2446 [Fusarium gaditjirri]